MAGCAEGFALSRRAFVGSAVSLSLWAAIPKLASASQRDPRLLTIILRGGLDGLWLASPVGDSDLERLRGRFAVLRTGDNAGLTLDDFFVLNPSMPYFHGLYKKREALIVHAVATPYRERSHFDGQDVLESGLPGVGRTENGWLNRALAGLATTGSVSQAGLADTSAKGLALGAVVPLVMRGSASVLSWIPQTFGIPLRESTVARLTDLYAETDPALAKAFADGMALDKVAVAATPNRVSDNGSPALGQPAPGQPPAGVMREFVDTAAAAARFMSRNDGPRIGVLSYNGWDTHANAGAVRGQLATRLAGLDSALKVFAEGMGPTWKDAVVIVVTEFGRTARVNGTEGTDHGTATAALLVGGAVRGGRVVADWPGLGEKALHQARDLRPTSDLRAVLKGVLRDHIGLPEKSLGETVFPSSGALAPMRELVV